MDIKDMVRNIPELDSIQAIEGSVESFGEINLKKRNTAEPARMGLLNL